MVAWLFPPEGVSATNAPIARVACADKSHEVPLASLSRLLEERLRPMSAFPDCLLARRRRLMLVNLGPHRLTAVLLQRHRDGGPHLEVLQPALLAATGYNRINRDRMGLLVLARQIRHR